MATTPLVLDAGVLKVGATDFSDAIMSVSILAEAASVTIPATLATPESTRAGARKYTLKVKYQSNDVSATNELWHVLYTALTTGDGTVVVTVQFRTGSLSATNPQWSGTVVVDQAQLGGDVGALSESDGTFVFTAQPTKTTS